MHKTILVLIAVCLAGCAAPGTSPNTTRHIGIPGDAIDEVKVASVNQWAEEKGATVVWIHYPQKPKDGDSGPLNP